MELRLCDVWERISVCASERDTKWRRPCRQQLWGWVEFTLLLPHLHSPLLFYPHFSVLSSCLMFCLFLSRRLKKRVNTHCLKTRLSPKRKIQVGMTCIWHCEIHLGKRGWRKYKKSRKNVLKQKQMYNSNNKNHFFVSLWGYSKYMATWQNS